MGILIKCIVKNSVGDTIGYDVVVNGKALSNVPISRLLNESFDNAILIKGSYPHLRGKKGSLPIREVSEEIVLYHGSDSVRRVPTLTGGKKNNDYGQGFYTTTDQKKGEDWALLYYSNSPVCNKYSLKMSGLKILNLRECDPLVWLALLVWNREQLYAKSKSDITKSRFLKAKVLFAKKYMVDIADYDVVVGYRADDSFFAIVNAFFDNLLSINEVANFFHKGDLGYQVFLCSEKGLSEECLTFDSAYKVSKADLTKVRSRDLKARKDVSQFIDNRKFAIQYENYIVRGGTFSDIISRLETHC